MVHQRLARHHDVQVVETNRRGHATRFAQDAARRGLDAVIAFGGDGTLNEVATGVAGTETALAVLPGGSTNVFARTLGMPNDAIAGVDLIVDALNRNDIIPVGLGRVNGRYFCFHTGVGYDAMVVKRVEERASLKRYAGHPLFVAAALQTWARDYDRKHPHFSVAIGDDVIPRAFFTIVLNTNPYTFLGNRPFDLVPGRIFSTVLRSSHSHRCRHRTSLGHLVLHCEAVEFLLLRGWTSVQMSNNSPSLMTDHFLFRSTATTWVKQNPWIFSMSLMQ